MSQDTPLLCPADRVRDFVVRLFSAYGLTTEHARAVADSLVTADLRGQGTHGVARVPSYVERLVRGLVNPKPQFQPTSRMPFAVAIDGDNAMGAVVATHAMGEALDRAEQFGMGAAVARRSNHFGAAGCYALMAAQRGAIGIVMSPASKSLAPFGSREPLLGTNPYAVAVPVREKAPWVMDMASSVAARGHIRLAARHGKPIPQGWALDAQGVPTTDAQAALSGVMIPFAGPKGSAIAMMVDIFGGVLSGSAFAGAIRDMNTDFEAPQDVGHFFMAMKVDAFMPEAEFYDRMDEAIARLKALKPAQGFDEVLYPGEPEARAAARRQKEGIPLTATVIAGLRTAGDAAGVTLGFEGAPAP